MKKLLAFVSTTLLAPGLLLGQSEEKNHRLWRLADDGYLGRLSANKYDSDSTSNAFGIYGSQYSPKSINNRFSSYGRAAQSRLSTSDSPVIIGQDGNYLGRLNKNKYDPESVANPFGRYGSRYSPDGINNPFGQYGSPYSPYSATNPYTLEAPKLFAPSSWPLRERREP